MTSKEREYMGFKVVDLLGLSGLFDYEGIFKNAGIEVELVQNFLPFTSTEDEVITAAADADIVIAQATYHPFTSRVLGSLTKCKFIISAGIGYDRLDIDAATDLGILVANVPDFCLDEVSDHTMALILACTRRIVRLNELVKNGSWKTATDPNIASEMWPKMSKLRGQTLGLIGFGRIPRALVPKARGFGLNIIAYDPYVAPDVFRRYKVRRVHLDELLAKSDIVSIHTPLTSETKHLLGIQQFRKMKPSACLVNTARGPVVNHDALYTALTQGVISAAAVDVTEPEPLPPDSPLLKLGNFMVTAHCAHASPSALATMQLRPAEEVVRVIKGEWPVGLINSSVKDKYRQKWAQP
jgi:D-3-phosphoglycerate dehydrogenase